jgi:hypothetical protein
MIRFKDLRKGDLVRSHGFVRLVRLKIKRSKENVIIGPGFFVHRNGTIADQTAPWDAHHNLFTRIKIKHKIYRDDAMLFIYRDEDTKIIGRNQTKKGLETYKAALRVL